MNLFEEIEMFYFSKNVQNQKSKKNRSINSRKFISILPESGGQRREVGKMCKMINYFLLCRQRNVLVSIIFVQNVLKSLFLCTLEDAPFNTFNWMIFPKMLRTIKFVVEIFFEGNCCLFQVLFNIKFRNFHPQKKLIIMVPIILSLWIQMRKRMQLFLNILLRTQKNFLNNSWFRRQGNERDEQIEWSKQNGMCLNTKKYGMRKYIFTKITFVNAF